MLPQFAGTPHSFVLWSDEKVEGAGEGRWRVQRNKERKGGEKAKEEGEGVLGELVQGL